MLKYVKLFNTLLIDMIIEETNKRMDVKYVRKKKLDEISHFNKDY